MGLADVHWHPNSLKWTVRLAHCQTVTKLLPLFTLNALSVTRRPRWFTAHQYMGLGALYHQVDFTAFPCDENSAKSQNLWHWASVNCRPWSDLQNCVLWSSVTSATELLLQNLHTDDKRALVYIVDSTNVHHTPKHRDDLWVCLQASIPKRCIDFFWFEKRIKPPRNFISLASEVVIKYQFVISFIWFHVEII